MRFMMLVKSAENSGPPPKELMEAVWKSGEEAAKSGQMIDSGGAEVGTSKIDADCHNVCVFQGHLGSPRKPEL